MNLYLNEIHGIKISTADLIIYKHQGHFSIKMHF